MSSHNLVHFRVRVGFCPQLQKGPSAFVEFCIGSEIRHQWLGSAFISGGGCDFPREWEGIWFQSTVRPYIAIAGDEMSGKGSCVERDRHAGEKYILRA